MLVHVDDAENAYDIRNDALSFLLMAGRVFSWFKLTRCFFFHVDDEHEFLAFKAICWPFSYR